MVRTKGARDSHYEERRQALVERLRPVLAAAGAQATSFRTLAGAVGVSVGALRHYFADRDTLVREVLALHAPGASRHLAWLRNPGDTFGSSVEAAAGYIALGLKQKVVADLHSVGLAEGLGRAGIGRTYLTEILEPMVEALEVRLLAHMERGEMRRVEARTAAIALIAPILLAHLHQDGLGGASTRPLAQAPFMRELVDGFVRGYRSEG